MVRSKDGASRVLFDTRVELADRLVSGGAIKIQRFELALLSPDGERVAFKALIQGGTMMGIFFLDSRIADVLDSNFNASTMVWSPNGRYVVAVGQAPLLNNSILIMPHQPEYTQIEISGNILANLGFEGYNFRFESLPDGRKIWRTEVGEPAWRSDDSLSFKARKVTLFMTWTQPPRKTEEPNGPPEDWHFDLVTKKFRRL